MNPQRARRRDGIVLLEVLVALVILSTAGIAAVALASAVSRSLAEARARDEDVGAASAFLDEVALWSREDLDRHLGDRDEGAWRLRVDHPSPSIYSIALSDAGAAGTLLETFLYKPEAMVPDAR